MNQKLTVPYSTCKSFLLPCWTTDISAQPKSPPLLPSESLHDSMDFFVLSLCINIKCWMWFCYSMLSAPLSSFKEETKATMENVVTLQAWEISVQGYLSCFQSGNELMYLNRCSYWQFSEIFFIRTRQTAFIRVLWKVVYDFKGVETLFSVVAVHIHILSSGGGTGLTTCHKRKDRKVLN